MSRLLAEAGEALYGTRWQSDLPRDLGVSDRTVRRWAAGTHQVPAGVHADLLRLVQDRVQLLGDLACMLDNRQPAIDNAGQVQ